MYKSTIAYEIGVCFLKSSIPFPFLSFCTSIVFIAEVSSLFFPALIYLLYSLSSPVTNFSYLYVTPKCPAFPSGSVCTILAQYWKISPSVLGR